MKAVFRALVVDDERLARALLIRLLDEFDEIHVVGQADSVETAVLQIDQHKPDVIFLDVQMPGGSGFELFKKCDPKARIIFVTAFDEHALTAFNVGALDYLLKPVESHRLSSAIKRLHEILPPGASTPKKGLIHTGDSVCFRQGGLMKFALAEEITFIAGADDYSEVFLSSKVSHLSDLRLADWEERLDPRTFVRIHRQTIININKIARVERKKDSSRVYLREFDDPLPIARRRQSHFKKIVDGFGTSDR